MANGNGKEGIAGPIIRTLFGDAGRFVLLGIALALLYNAAVNFKQDMVRSNDAVNKAFAEYVAANEKRADLDAHERAELIRRANIRLKRLYERNGWEYVGIGE